jgi:N-acyl-D-aspartate/D-glutamate deacylase
MRRKGRGAAGTDADLVVFDDACVTDQATYAASTRPSSGIATCSSAALRRARRELVPDALPGQPVRATPR